MTRQFNNQPRNNSRPPSRNIPANRYGEEQSSNPARPRLNRAMVDRGWENGTPRHHADYHPRMNNGQAPHTNWRKNQEAGNSSYNGPTGNRTNGNRQAPSSEPSSQRSSAPRNRPFNHQQGDESHSYNNRQAQTNQRQPQGRGSNFGAQEHNQGRSNDYGNNRSQPHPGPSHDYGNNRSQPHPGPSHDYGNNRPQPHRRPFNRNDRPQGNPEGKSYRGFNERSTSDNQEQREPHPRFQSRPATFQRGQENRRPQETQRNAPYPAYVKSNYQQGGYETPEQAQSVTRKRRSDRSELPPKGYVSKRQRKDTELRASINEDAEGLINPVRSSQREQSKVHEETALLSEITMETASKVHEETLLPSEMITENDQNLSPNQQTKRAENVRKGKKAEVLQSPSKGPRPSQRGHKWPQP